MAKPTILAVDDDAAVAGAIVRDLRSRYGADYRVLRATSGGEALELMADLALKDRPVAAVVSDQRMPEMTGIEVLREVRRNSPDSKLMLLTAYADTDVAIQAINDIALDYYLMKPWDPPEDRLYPVLDDLLEDWRRAHPDRASEVRVLGHRWSEGTHEVKSFLTHNHVPYRWLEVDQGEEAARLLELAGAGPDDLPVVALPDGEALRSPTTVELAEALGLRTQADQPLYDLCIVGAGPAGLAAAVYAASEGLQTVVVERDAPGGQAGQSASIENYLGFPKGLSGADLTHRAVAQAARFGAEMVLARDVTGFETRGPVRAVLLDGSAAIEARAVLVATGVSYRRLEAPGLEGIGLPRRRVRRERQRGGAVLGRGGPHRGGGQLGRPGRAELRQVRQAGGPPRPRRDPRGLDVAVPRQPYHGRPEHRRTAADRGGRRPRRQPPRSAHPRRPGRRHRGGGGGELAVRVHRRGSSHRLARRRGGPRPVRLRAHRAGAVRPAPRPPGRWTARRSHSRPASPACSPPATSGSTA